MEWSGFGNINVNVIVTVTKWLSLLVLVCSGAYFVWFYRLFNKKVIVFEQRADEAKKIYECKARIKKEDGVLKWQFWGLFSGNWSRLPAPNMAALHTWKNKDARFVGRVAHDSYVDLKVEKDNIMQLPDESLMSWTYQEREKDFYRLKERKDMKQWLSLAVVMMSLVVVLVIMIVYNEHIKIAITGMKSVADQYFEIAKCAKTYTFSNVSGMPP